MDIKQALLELRPESVEKILEIETVTSWLKKNIELYNYYRLNWNKNSCYGELPCRCTLKSEQSKFLALFESLNRISEIHKNEAYFKKELIKYKKIFDNQDRLNNWLNKNETIITNSYIDFFIEYLDYSEDPYHLKINTNIFDKFEVFVNRDCFKNTIEILEIFNILYWEKGDNKKSTQKIIPKTAIRIGPKSKNYKQSIKSKDTKYIVQVDIKLDGFIIGIYDCYQEAYEVMNIFNLMAKHPSPFTMKDIEDIFQRMNFRHYLIDPDKLYNDNDNPFSFGDSFCKGIIEINKEFTVESYIKSRISN